MATPEQQLPDQASTPDRLKHLLALVRRGEYGLHLLEDRDWEEQAAFLELMMFSVAQMCHRFIPPMRERGFGRVINVSSFATAHTATPMDTARMTLPPTERTKSPTLPGKSTIGAKASTVVRVDAKSGTKR